MTRSDEEHEGRDEEVDTFRLGLWLHVVRSEMRITVWAFRLIEVEKINIYIYIYKIFTYIHIKRVCGDRKTSELSLKNINQKCLNYGIMLEM